MGSFNDLPNQPPSDGTASDRLLDDIKQNLQRFQTDWVDQLTADVGRLQAEKVELLSTISELKQEQKVLRDQHSALLTQQQLAQQKVWAKQLSEALANRLYVLLAQRMGQSSSEPSPRGDGLSALGGSASTSLSGPGTVPPQALQSLNLNLSNALLSLQNDLNQTDSMLMQQLSQGNDVDEQRQVLLNQLVERLKTQMRGHASMPSDAMASGANEYTAPSPVPSSFSSSESPLSGAVMSDMPISESSFAGASYPANVDPETMELPVPQTSPGAVASAAVSGVVLPASTPEAAPKLGSTVFDKWANALNLSSFQLGIVLVVLSTIALSLHNVVVGVIGNESSLFNRLPAIGGVVNLNSLDSSLLLLWLRMIIVVPLMAFLATSLYPRTWTDVRSFLLNSDRKLLGTVVGSGAFLFASQVAIYISIGEIGPGVAVTLLFIHPILMAPLAWYFFNDRPTILRWGVLAGVFLGIVLTSNIAPLGQDTPANLPDSLSSYGVGMGLLSGVFFALYLIFMQLSFRKLHPVPVSAIQFFTIFALTSILLIVFPSDPAKVDLSDHLGLFVGAIILGGLTLAGYLFNNFGIRYMGAARASIIASAGPALTAVLGWAMVPERYNLRLVQWVGVLLVTGCVAALSLERLFQQQQADG